MTQRTGSANLPLHDGRVPAWLATRMATLLNSAKLGRSETLEAIRRLDEQARRVDEVVAQRGRTV